MPLQTCHTLTRQFNMEACHHCVLCAGTITITSQELSFIADIVKTSFKPVTMWYSYHCKHTAASFNEQWQLDVKLLYLITISTTYPTSKCLTMLTTSRVEYGYVMSPWSAIVRNSPNARTNRRRVSSGTWGPYCCSIDISDCMSGLSTVWQLNTSPTAQYMKNMFIQ